MRSLLSTLVLLLVVFLFVGWWRGWVTFNKESDANGDKVGYGVTIDKPKAKEDAQKLAEKTNDALKSGDEKKMPTEPVTVRGTIATIDANQRLVLKTNNNAEVKIDLEASTSITLNDRTARLTDLHVGDEATVNYGSRGGKNVATEVAAVHHEGSSGMRK